jgi:predicted ATPase
VLSAEVVDQIIERTDGVPLFVEELTKAMLEIADAGDGTSAAPATALVVPATLHASLMARLDRLGPTAKEVAQVGAGIGREFPYGLLVATAQRKDEELQDGLDGLVNAGLVFQRGAIPAAAFSFKHALVRDTAHGTLLRGPRQRLHARIAEVMELQSPELMETQPELLAQHYAEAGLVEKSVTFWGKAGQRSASRSTMAEAAAQFQKGLDQLTLMPNTPARQRQELEFWIALGSVLQAAKGQAAPETGHAYARARELCEQLGSPSEFRQLSYAQSVYHLVRGEFDLAQRLADELLRLGRARNDTDSLVLGHHCSGQNLMLIGRFTASLSHLEEGLACYDPMAHRSLPHQIGTHAHVVSQASLVAYELSVWNL